MYSIYSRNDNYFHYTSAHFARPNIEQAAQQRHHVLDFSKPVLQDYEEVTDEYDVNIVNTFYRHCDKPKSTGRQS